MSQDTKDKDRLDFLSHMSMETRLKIKYWPKEYTHAISWHNGQHQVESSDGLRSAIDKAILLFYGRDETVQQQESTNEHEQD